MTDHPLPTVLIETANGPVRVNLSDYEEDQASKKPTMKLADDQTIPEAAPEADDAAAEQVVPGQLLVSKEGRKFYVVDGTGTKFEGAGINSAGYPTEVDAWAAVMALAPKSDG